VARVAVLMGVLALAFSPQTLPRDVAAALVRER
jgi:hypothetical protein